MQQASEPPVAVLQPLQPLRAPTSVAPTHEDPAPVSPTQPDVIPEAIEPAAAQETAAALEAPATSGLARGEAPSPSASPALPFGMRNCSGDADRIFAVLTTEPKTYRQLSVLSGVPVGMGDAINVLLARGVVIQRAIDGLQCVYLVGAPAENDDRSDQWPN